MNQLKKTRYSVESLVKGIRGSDTIALSRGITLVESQLESDITTATELINQLIETASKSVRIGITGVPGVGKSTFIESFGNYLTEIGKKVAVLSIDPSSSRSQGSILGDKTRMNQLSANPMAFIRPSPSGSGYGGVASSTRESILLCEAAGYDVIIVETVGVGQSETVVRDMVDFFLLLMLPGGGDELQGIKRGIMEMADGIFINKADTDPERAKRARKDYQNAIHLFPPNEADWAIPVEIGSSTENEGIEKVWENIQSFVSHTSDNQWFQQQRATQQLKWFHQLIDHRLRLQFYTNEVIHQKVKTAKVKIATAEISVRSAVEELFS